MISRNFGKRDSCSRVRPEGCAGVELNCFPSRVQKSELPQPPGFHSRHGRQRGLVSKNNDAGVLKRREGTT